LVTLVLLVTCTHVGNLMMVRNSARRRELAVRAALGAGRGWWCSTCSRAFCWLILSMLPLPAMPESLAFRVDVRVLGFAAGVSLLRVRCCSGSLPRGVPHECL
jgi:hypothetical protein